MTFDPVRMQLNQRDVNDVLSALKMNMRELHKQIDAGSNLANNEAKLERLINLHGRVLNFGREHAHRTRAYREQQTVTEGLSFKSITETAKRYLG